MEAKQIDLKQTILDYLHGPGIEEGVLIARLENAIKGIIEKNEFNDAELEWLRWNYDKLEVVISNQLCASIFYLLSKFKALSVTRIAMRLGKYHDPIKYWVEKLRFIDLVKKHKYGQGWGRQVLFFLNKNLYPNIFKIILEEIIKEYSEPKLKELASVNKELQEISDKNSKSKKIKTNW